MGLRIERVKDELSAFYAEVVVENGPRYRKPKDWPHLYVDLFVATFQHLAYTLGHIVAVGLPIWAAYALWNQ